MNIIILSSANADDNGNELERQVYIMKRKVETDEANRTSLLPRI